MNIIFSNYDDLKNPWYGGGGARAVHEVAMRLARGNSVTVITGTYPGAKDETLDGVSYARIGTGKFGPFVGQAIYQTLLPWQAFRRRYDIWIESFTPPFSTAFLPWFTRRPVVGVTHSLSGRDMSKKYHLPFQLLETLGLQLYSNVITLTEYQKSKVLAANKKINVRIIPNGLPKQIIERPAVHGEKHILFLGRIDIVQKGLDVLLSAYSQISKIFPYPLIIAGNGPEHEQNKLKELIQSFRLEGRVQCAGRVEGEAKFKLFEQAVCTVMPSRSEGFPLVALEAMACGSPLIVSDIPGLQWVPQSCSEHVDGLTAEAFVATLNELLGDQVKRTRMSEAARREAQDYNWDKITAEYTQVVSDLTNA